MVTALPSTRGLLLPSVGGDLVGSPRELRRRLKRICGDAKRQMSRGQDTEDGAADLPSATYAHRRTRHVERVDEDERRLEGAIRAVEMDVDGLFTGGAEGQELP